MLGALLLGRLGSLILDGFERGRDLIERRLHLLPIGVGVLDVFGEAV